MRILHVTDAHEFSGGVKQLKLLMEGLRGKSEVLAQAVVAAPGGRVVDSFRVSGFEVHPVAMFQDYDLIAAWKLGRIIRRFQPDVVHAHHPKAHAVTLIARHFLKFRLVVSRRVTHPIPPFPTSRWKYGSPLIDRFVCVSGAVGEKLKKAGVREEKIAVIGSSTDFERFRPGDAKLEVLKQLGINGAKPAVLAVIANYSSWKGHDLFVQALSLLGSREKKFMAFIAGRDTDGEALISTVNALGLSGQVRLLGWREDVEALLAAADVLVCPSLSGEGSSGAIREAFAMKVPVIASDIHANAELVDSARGWLFEAGNSQSLADAIGKFLSALEAARREKTERAFTFVREHFSVQSMADKTLSLYRRVCAG